MSIIISIIAFVIIFSVLILIHEYGHFAMARKVGIRVEEFGMGLPPRALKLWKDKKETIFSLNWIPFGGFVRMHGEDAHDPKLLRESDSFIAKTKWQRTLVICAGVFMNFLLGAIILSGLFFVGTEPIVLDERDFMYQVQHGNIILTDELHEALQGGGLLVGNIIKDSVAEKSGFHKMDVVTKINGIPMETSEQLRNLTQQNAGKELIYTVRRSGKEQTITALVPAEGKIGIFIQLPSRDDVKEIKKITLPIHEAIAQGVIETGRLSVATALLFKDVVIKMVSQFEVSESVAGPVGIAVMTHTFSQQGIMALLKFTALLSISLAVINILPLPALDGGRLLFIVFEAIRGKPLNLKWESYVHGVGFLLLMLLILVITYKDILRIIYG